MLETGGIAASQALCTTLGLAVVQLVSRDLLLNALPLNVGFVVHKVSLRQAYPPSTYVFTLSVRSHDCSILLH